MADYSQIELRIMAHLSGDPAFIEAFQQGGDIHRQTAALIFGVPVEQVTPDMRGRAKTINFATIYGQGPFALSRQLGITQEDAKAFIAQYFERFAGVRAFLDRQVAARAGAGLRRDAVRAPPLHPRDPGPELQHPRATASGNAQNSPLQGSAADLIKLAMIRIHDAIARAAAREPDAAPGPRRAGVRGAARRSGGHGRAGEAEMEQVMPLRVPLVVDIGVGANWLDAKS